MSSELSNPRVAVDDSDGDRNSIFAASIFDSVIGCLEAWEMPRVDPLSGSISIRALVSCQQGEVGLDGNLI